MTAKTAPAKVHQNGTPLATATLGKEAAVTVVPMAGFQLKYVKRLIDNFNSARDAITQAQNAANDFIFACAEEEGIVLGQDGWTFDQKSLEFVKIPEQQGGGDGNDS